MRKKIPEEVIGIFNELITLNYNNGTSKVLQDVVVTKISEVLGIERNKVFANHYLDIEDLYTEWDVIYDKPGYNESYAAFFIFNKKN